MKKSQKKGRNIKKSLVFFTVMIIAGLILWAIPSAALYAKPGGPPEGKAEIVVSKVDENGSKLKDAEIGLYDADGGNLLEKDTTKGNGEVKFKNLTINTDYWVHEIKAPDGYSGDDAYHKVTTGGDKSSESVTIVNEKIVQPPDDPEEPVIVEAPVLNWGGNGSENADLLSCSHPYWHWILTPGGGTIDSARLTVILEDNDGTNQTITVDGYRPSGGDKGAMHFDVEVKYGAKVISASVVYKYPSDNEPKNSVLTISHNECRVTPVKAKIVIEKKFEGDDSIKPPAEGYKFTINGQEFYMKDGDIKEFEAEIDVEYTITESIAYDGHKVKVIEGNSNVLYNGDAPASFSVKPSQDKTEIKLLVINDPEGESGDGDGDGDGDTTGGDGDGDTIDTAGITETGEIEVLGLTELPFTGPNALYYIAGMILILIGGVAASIAFSKSMRKSQS